MPFSRKPKRIFGIAVTIIAMCGAASFVTMYQLFSSEEWVRHTFRVELALAVLESNLERATHYRLAFLDSRDPQLLNELKKAQSQIKSSLLELRQLTADNPAQQEQCGRLIEIANARLRVEQRSIDLRPSGEVQADVNDELIRVEGEATSIIDQMAQAEETLLRTRRNITSGLFAAILTLLFVFFCVAVLLLRKYYRLLSAEFRERQAAESNAQSLSVALMKAQDEERRRFSRELHDSLGQLLTGAKLTADTLSTSEATNRDLVELIAMLDDAISQTRTISQLLYPPLLDEVGFVSAAAWFIENYSQRTGIKVTFERPSEAPTLPNNLELTLFRVLQEALTNIHKHAKSAKAEVYLLTEHSHIVMRIKDYGVGIPAEKLANFQASGIDVGVGLAGMRSRVKEQGGNLSIECNDRGTVISVDFDLAMIERSKPLPIQHPLRPK